MKQKLCCLNHQEINPKTGKRFAKCAECRRHKQIQRAKLKKQGICVTCYGPSRGKTRCLKCSRRMKASCKDRGRCQSCSGKNDTLSSLCSRCVYKNVAFKRLGDRKRWSELRDLFEQQKCLCAVTNKPIVIGSNASIDHIVPSNRGGTDEISNLRWVHIVFNRMKNDMLDKELLEWAKSIVQSESRLALDDEAQVGPPCLLKAPAGRIHSWPSGTKTSSTG